MARRNEKKRYTYNSSLSVTVVVGETEVSGFFYNPFLVPVHQKYKRVFSDIQPKIYAQGMQPPAGATQ